VVVDPREDVSEYIRITRERGVKITHVLETHIHADHISGARKLAKLAKAPLHLHESAEVEFRFEPLTDGQVLEVGNLELRVLHTPGHTTESISLLYVDKTRTKLPWAVLTGDTLFVGDVGRLDLVGAGTPRQMHHSIFNRLLALEDFTEVYPAHYAGSVCGKGMSPKTTSTIGFERRFNPALQVSSVGEFTRYLKSNALKPFPEHKRIKARNSGLAWPPRRPRSKGRS
jgi:glyoxylase-like metal-dependent hydrolase (beta-lactamase superfamily II)